MVTLAIHPPFYRSIKSFTIEVFSYPLRVYSRVKDNFRSKRSVIEDNEELKKLVAEKNLKLQRYDLLEKENKRLRELIGLERELSFPTVSSQIIARSPARWFSSFVIDRGTADGVYEGAAVAGADGLVGMVSDARSATSTVVILTHPNFTAGGTLERTGVNAIVVGSAEGEVLMQYIPLETDVREGDAVYTSRHSSIFPEGILVGTVKKIMDSPRGLSQTAYIEPSSDLYKLQELLCIIRE